MARPTHRAPDADGPPLDQSSLCLGCVIDWMEDDPGRARQVLLARWDGAEDPLVQRNLRYLIPMSFVADGNG